MSPMLRVISAVVVEGLFSAIAVAPPRIEVTPSMWVVAPADPVDALHRTGEELFDAKDYAGARVAWTEAYERVEVDDGTWPYRTTLLSLIVTATLFEFSGGGERASVRQAAELIDAALAAELDTDVRMALEEERERLAPYLDPVPPPADAPRPEGSGWQGDPDQDPGTTPLGAKDTDTGADHRIPTPIWIGAGGGLLGGGLAGLIAGSRFGPRATRQVMDAGDSTSIPPGSTFIEDERRKGVGWMATGAVVAATGVTALVVGIVRLARERKR